MGPFVYTAALEAYAASLPQTYGQEKIAFVYAHPTAELVEGIGKPRIENGKSIEMDQWPKSVKETAAELGALAAGKDRATPHK
jgi:hypothetical protein